MLGNLFLILSSLRLLTSVLSGNTTGTSTTEWGGLGEVNVLLGVQSNNERWDVDNLLTNSNVSLGDQDTGMVDRSGQTQLVNLGLQTSLQEVLWLQGQNVIQLLLVLGQDTSTDQSSDQSVTFEQSLWVFLVTGQQVTGSTSDLRQLEVDSVDLTLVLQTELTSELQLSVQTSRLVWSLWDSVSLGVCSWSTYENC